MASWSCVVWIVEWVWAGRGLALAEGWAADCRALVCGVVGLSGAWCRKHARCCLMGGGGCPCVCGGGMLSGFWGSAPWLPDPSGAPGLLGVVGGCGWVGCELYSGREHLTVRFLRQSVSCFVRVSLLFVFLSVRWMPWHQGPMKDVVACDIPRGAGWRAVIRGFPNGGTRHELCRVTCI